MQRLFAKYGEQGFMVQAFPCNQFGGQEPKSEPEIKAFAQGKFGAEFWMSSKLDVNGDDTHPVYEFLKGPEGCFPGDITWNFASKFLIDHRGVPMYRFEKESWEDIEAAIVQLLKDRNAGGDDE